MAHSFTNKRKTWFQTPWVALILLVLVGLGCMSVVRAFAKEREAAKLKNEYARELQEMDKKQTELLNQIETLSTPRGIEGEIRNRYRMAKPGEQLVVVVDNGKEDQQQKNLTFWMKMRAFVGI